MLLPKEKEVLQKRMSQHFGVLEGVETDIDDIIIHAYREMKHDFRLNSVLDRCQKINLTLRQGKMCLQSQGGDPHWSQTYTRGDQARS